MPCVDYGNLVVCSPRSWKSRQILWCKKCKRRTRHIVSHYEWYDPDARCLAHEVKPKERNRAWAEATTGREAIDALLAAVFPLLDRDQETPG